MSTRTSKEWMEEIPKKHQLIVLNPDGWDRQNYHHSFNKEKITFGEFKKRLGKSTIMCKGDLDKSIEVLERKHVGKSKGMSM